MRVHGCWILALGLLALAGCDMPRKPLPREQGLISPYVGVRTLAVAPVLNQSGSRDFDVLTVSDLLFGELQQVNGLNVLPVNKTLAAMGRLGMRRIDSAEAAEKIAAELGADGIVVGAVTAFDPYRPPTMGMTMQIFAPRGSGMAGAEPQARGISGAAVSGTGGVPETPGGAGPVAHVAGYFPASNQTVLLELRDFAKGRSVYESSLQEDRYLADMDGYTRFVCHAMVRRLLQVESMRVAGR